MAAASLLAAGSDFVSVSGTGLYLGGEPYFFAGTNFWYGLNLASSGPGGDRDRLHRELDRLRDLKVRNLRIMAGSEGPDSEPWRMVPALQTAPGVYNADVLDGLDYLLKAMGDRHLQAVMCLSNFWPWSGGLAQYVSWNGGGAIPYPPPEPGGDWNFYQDYASDFYTSPGAQQDYLDHFEFLALRVNPYTGLAYRDDPTIMAWELANEPRGFHNNATAFNQWIDQAAAYIKTIDSNHLVTTGCEGDTPWPSWNGLDFIANHDGPDIDYGTIHIWPQNWGWYDPSDPGGTYAAAEASARSYFNAHEGMATTLGKPMILEEFGLARDGGSYDPASTTTWRETFLAAMYEEVHLSASTGGPAAGDNVWAWAGEGRPLEPYGSLWSPGDPWIGDPPHEHQGWYSVYDGDTTTLDLLSAHGDAMLALIPTSAVEDGEGSEGLREGSLEISPSPGAETVLICGRLPAAVTDACLEVYDISGRLLSRFPSCTGVFELPWPDGRLNSGRLSSGIYFARLSWGRQHLTAKFVYLK
jgi:mannan endo-1,4-beta-mannosidase